MVEDIAGQDFGPYKVVKKIGVGGWANVYQAYQPGVDRYVALKLLPPQFTHDPEFAQRFQQEARVIAKLEHSHILPLFDFGQIGGQPYIAMRFIPSGTLADRITKGLLPADEALRYLTQVAEALDYAHSRGIIHRDIKPSNILIDPQQNALLADFGLAKIVEASAVFTKSGVLIGTPRYMSPEQGQGRPLDCRSDLYSLAVVIFEVLTGHPPYDADTPVGAVVQHMTAPIPRATVINPALPDTIDGFFERALAKDPKERYQSAHSLIQALSHALIGEATAREAAPQERHQRAASAGAPRNTQPWASRAKPAVWINKILSARLFPTVLGTVIVALLGALAWRFEWFGGPGGMPTAAASIQLKAAVVRAIVGTATVQGTEGATPQTLSVGDVLGAGLTIVTDPSGTVDLELPGGAMVRLLPSTRLRTEQLPLATADSIGRLVLLEGVAWVQLPENLAVKPTIEVQTAAGTGSVGGSVMRDAYSINSGHFLVSCISGECSLRAGTTTINLVGGEEAEADEGTGIGGPARLVAEADRLAWAGEFPAAFPTSTPTPTVAWTPSQPVRTLPASPTMTQTLTASATATRRPPTASPAPALATSTPTRPPTSTTVPPPTDTVPPAATDTPNPPPAETAPPPATSPPTYTVCASFHFYSGGSSNTGTVYYYADGGPGQRGATLNGDAYECVNISFVNSITIRVESDNVWDGSMYINDNYCGAGWYDAFGVTCYRP